MDNLTKQIEIKEKFESEIVLILGQKWFVRKINFDKQKVLCELLIIGKAPAQFRLEWFLEEAQINFKEIVND